MIEYDFVEILGFGAGKRFTMQNWTLENPALQSMHSLQRWPTWNRESPFTGLHFQLSCFQGAPFSAFASPLFSPINFSHFAFT